MRVAFDIGGTFTDVILFFDEGRIRTAKVLSSPSTIGESIRSLIEQCAADEGVSSYVHATTVCSNALIERTTPPVALITTKGFRDVLELMDQRGPSTNDINWQRLVPLVPRHLRFEVDERVLTDGSALRAVDPADIEAVAADLAQHRVGVVAVCLINSFVNGDHEQQVGKALARLAPHVTICLSSDVHPEVGEYARMSTTVINASLLPVVNDYLDRLAVHLDRYSLNLRIMQSNGGTAAATVARQRPMTMVESGPAAGVLAAACVAQTLDLDAVLSFDMGGTTAKACLIEGGRPLEKPGSEIAGSTTAVTRRSHGHPLRVPSFDIVEIGAGGGSIAWIDASGAIRVGAMSAGADPGPACYAQGGLLPTVTDANLVVGYANPAGLADGTLPLDVEAARHTIQVHIASPLGMDLLPAAHGIIEVANSTMMRALRAVSTERGRDIRFVTILAFGGCGPLHAGALGRAAGVESVIVPLHPGVFSALGLLLAGERLDYVRSIERPLVGLDVGMLSSAHEAMMRLAESDLRGVASSDLVFTSSVDIRLGRKAGELNVPIDGDSFDLERLAARFHDIHKTEFGFHGEGEMNLVNVRLSATFPGDRLRLGDLRYQSSASSGTVVVRERLVYFGPRIGLRPTRVLSRDLITGRQDGPLLVDEETTTIVVPAEFTVERDELDNLILRRSSPDAEEVTTATLL